MTSSLSLPLLALLALLLLSHASPASFSKETDRLIEFAPGKRVWMSQSQLEELDIFRHQISRLGVGYFDVTDREEPADGHAAMAVFTREFPTRPAFQDVVGPLLAKMQPSKIESMIDSLAKFPNRYYTTASGVESAVFLRDHMAAIAAAAGRNDVNCTLFEHSFAQPSVICTILGRGPNADEVIVTGAHLDSVNSRSVPNGIAPGADDDASGVASFVETFRVLVESGFQPSRTIEFMGYAAEEVGLRGSQAVADHYGRTNRKVYAVYQNEMSGYVGRSPSVVILQDFVDPNLAAFTENLVGEYCSIPATKAVCGYGCSDHASWDRLGFAAICTAEAGPFGDVNPYMHTDKDTLDKLDMDFTTEFGKLALAFVVELSLY